MRKPFQKFVTAGATAAIVATAVAPAAFAAEHPFTDVGPNYSEAVDFLYVTEIIQGTSTTTFGTYLNLTRGDAAVILANVLGLDTENAKDAGFKDLFPRIRGAVNALAEEGIISGVTKDKFDPHAPLSRGAMAKLLVKAFELEEYSTKTPFNDAAGVFKPYIEALYGTEITSGKSPTSYGTYQEITRGDFANLLYNTFIFILENGSIYVESVNIIDSKSFTLQLEEPLDDEYTAEDITDLFYFWADFNDGTSLDLIANTSVISTDRKSITITHRDLTGEEGVLFIGDFEFPFDYAAPKAKAGVIQLEGVDPVNFDFAGKTTTNVTLPATNGSANLNGIEFTVEDANFTNNQTVTVILKSTDVAAAKPGEGLTWGTLTYDGDKWALVDDAKYDFIPVGHYTLETQFKDSNENSTTLTLEISVEDLPVASDTSQ
ncbi:S-layer homology domain-containing protein [Ferdinandcohnia quinoae]|uniref:S-layer homology domain-containing protein n=1 Tax=Fredinandcohnia quinoae TaxID=2918902 RepID=A0AAW5E8K8_9BACI|nr:S-layer homology domain-containing protein [Fredinandcohnia sp. SECRCQ15]MCH1625104.1 S-layer homology domain-containing protein [Fredinandcohnia sp. SECRCQ15]